MLRIATRLIALFAILLVALVLPAMASGDDTINFEERVRYQRLIEDVYWQNRIWPEENPGAKPALDEVLPDAIIRERVQSYLEKSAALEQFWSRPLTGIQLQAEIDRMASHTKNPEMLAELFAALDDDPFLIAECLARPVLVDRLTRNWYARDTRFHGDLKEQAETALAVYSGDVARMPALGGEYQLTEWRLVLEEPQIADLDSEQAEHSTIDLSEEEWSDQIERITMLFGIEPDPDEIPLGTLSRLTEENDRFVVLSVLSAGQDSLQTATVTWSKRPFDAWWVEDGRIAIGSNSGADPVSSPSEGYKVRSRHNSGCSDDTWTDLWRSPSERSGHKAVWTGAEMIVWGGYLQYIGKTLYLATGGLYNPATDSWTATSTGNGAPSGRNLYTAVWTGTEMIVWGGIRDDGGYVLLNTGGRYNPATNSWTATSTGDGVPSARVNHTAVWTGTEMIVWGGIRDDGEYIYLNTGGRYDPETDSWTTTSTGNAVPSWRIFHTAVWTGTEMIVWGGYNPASEYLNTGGRYDPETDSWTSTSTGSGAPTARAYHTAVWTGTEMIVWGGTVISYMNTGGRYDPETDSWTATSTGNGVPSGRVFNTTVWTGTEMVVWGGYRYGKSLNTGGAYDPETDSWTPTSTGASVPSGRYWHTAVWTGTEMIVWGGFGDDGGYHYYLNTGGRYDPETDSWTPTSAGNGVPLGRFGHTAVWNGAEMIVWGGISGASGSSGLYMNTGGRYDPATDSWTATAIGDGVPSGRDSHTAVWTGTEMIVWGGYRYEPEYLDRFQNTGGRYNPVTDSWMSTSTGEGVPHGRTDHTAVWTGTEMIVWGGFQDDMAGLELFPNACRRYDPVTDRWMASSAVDGAPSGRISHTAVWTGTEMIIWGGYIYDYLEWEFVPTNTGGRYDPATDSWTATSIEDGVPSERTRHTAVWTGEEMIVWGGYIYTYVARDYIFMNTGGRYDPATDRWTATSIGDGVPSDRTRHTAVWTGTEMIVWGGYQYDMEALYFNTGGRYDPASDSWMATSIEAGVPPERYHHTAVWTGTEMIVWGGYDGNVQLSSGGLYCACEGVRERERYEIHDDSENEPGSR